MSLALTADHAASSKTTLRTRLIRWTILLLVVALLGGGGWYYFLGRKPKIALSVPLKSDGTFENRSWPVGAGQVLLLSGGEVRLCDLEGRTEKWSAKMPAAPSVDPEWQARLNTRFLKLQQWSIALAQKRATLTTQQSIKAFNEEAAKYQAELLAARAESQKPAPPKPASGDDSEPSAKPVPRFAAKAIAAKAAPAKAPTGEDPRIAAARVIATQAAAQTSAAQDLSIPPASPNPLAPKALTQPVLANAATAPALRQVIPAEVRMLQDRIARRQKTLADMDRNIQTKAAAAKSDLARGEVKELAAKRAAVAAEQTNDQNAVATALSQAAPSTPVPAKVAAPAAVQVAQAEKAPLASAPAEAGPDEEESNDSFSSFQDGPAQAAVLGDRAWIIDGSHVVAFALADGALKADVRLAGPAARIFSDADVLFIVAEAGPQSRQLTRIDATGATTSLYVSTPHRERAFSGDAEGGLKINIRPQSSEFTSAGGSLARADIRLLQQKVKTIDAIKPGSEKALEKSIENSTAHSSEEVIAISNMMAADALRESGQAIQQVDDSLYEVTISRPFEAALPVWTGRVQGRVQLISTPTLDLVTAGTKLIALDRTNKMKWEATLGAPVPQRNQESDWTEEPAPMIESACKLFFADGAFLTAFDLATGQVQWRLPSVGIRKLVADADGNLYVQTDNLSVDSLHYVSSDSLHPPTSSTLKVAADTGKIAWEAPKFQDVWVSGKDVYAFREIKNAADATEMVFDPKNVPEARVKFYKLSRSDGQPIWEWFQTRRPHHVIAHDKYVAILFRDELQVIHSIAL